MQINLFMLALSASSVIAAPCVPHNRKNTNDTNAPSFRAIPRPFKNGHIQHQQHGSAVNNATNIPMSEPTASAPPATPSATPSPVSGNSTTNDASWIQGPMTHYDAPASGAKDSCGNPHTADTKNIAISGAIRGAHPCGQMIEVKFNGKTAQFPATNTCPECPPEHIDLTEAAFKELTGGSLEPGKPTVEWRFI